MRKLVTSELDRPDPVVAKDLPKAPLIVVLDNVRSALNTGSFFRTCDAFAVEALYLCGITAVPPHKEILKTAIGATESVSWRYSPDTSSALADLHRQGFVIIGVEQTDESVELLDYHIDPTKKYALVFGNEVDGLSDATLPQLHGAIEIRQLGSKHSLNVSVCGGIVIHHFVRHLPMV